MTYGFSRDDAGKFLNAYYDKKIFESDPFAKLDQTGVGRLMKMAVSSASRSIRTCISESAASTAEIRHRSSSATASDLTMCPARRSVCRSRDWQRLRRQLRTNNRFHIIPAGGAKAESAPNTAQTL
jgi:hypothetical protein